MKRTLSTLMFLALIGMVLAGPPVDYQLVCGEGPDAPVVGVASLVEDGLRVAYVEGALETCVDGIFGVLDGERVFTLSVTPEGAVAVAFDDAAYAPELTYDEVPEVAVQGMLGAQQNRANARASAMEARERASGGGPPFDVPVGGGDGDDEQEDVEDEDGDGSPADVPAPTTRGRR
jgi:hypothetical protein